MMRINIRQFVECDNLEIKLMIFRASLNRDAFLYLLKYLYIDFIKSI